ncbi:MAG: NPCBM/NEW2 domain-containing protein [Polyangiaceae bacterium]
MKSIVGKLLLGLFVLSGCSGVPVEDVAEASLALADPTRVLGFEAVADWSSQQGTLALSSVHSQGVSGVSLRSTYYADIVSVPLGSVGTVGTSVSYDVRLPTSVRTGTVTLIVESQQAGLYYVTLGQTNLANLPVSTFSTVSFPLSASVATKLRATYSDLKLHLIVNATVGTDPIVFDNLRFSENPRQAACVDPSALLLNSGFEQGSGSTPSNWQVDTGGNAAVAVSWVAGAGRSSSKAMKISNTSTTAARPRVFQRVALQPYTPYILRGWMRFENPRAIQGQEFVADVAADPYYLASGGPRSVAEAGTSWQQFSVDFQTGYNGAIDITARLAGGGTVYFDDLKIECNTSVRRYQSQHFILDLDPDKEAAAGSANVEKVVARTEEAILALAELTGQTTVLNQWKQSGWAPARFLGGGVAGYPFLWASDPDYMRANWGLEAFLPEIFAHEIGHNFDSTTWEFNGDELASGNEFNEFKAYYVYETRNYAIAENGYARGAAMRSRYLEPYQQLWQRQHCARPDGLIYREILVKDAIGWEPYRQTYRYMLGTNLPTAWSRISTFHQKLAQFSGKPLTGSAADVAAGRALFGTDEWQWIETFYNRLRDVTPTVPSAVAASVKTFSLGDATWTSARTEWGNPSRNGFEGDGCPYATATRAYTKGLWAHASSEYVFDLGGAWTTFDADFGIAVQAQSAPIHFSVLDGDGRLLFDSASVSDNVSRHVTLNVAGKQKLILRVDPVGTSADSAWGLWLDPTLRR